MIIRRLVEPTPEPEQRRQCQVVLPDDPSWMVTRKQAYDRTERKGRNSRKPAGWDAQSCQRWADVSLDGVELCRGHAGRKLLCDALGEEFPFGLRN